MSNLQKHAWLEFKAAGWLNEHDVFSDEMQESICMGVMDLLRVFSEQGHSGSTAPYTINLFTKLAAFEPIVPLTGEDWEWSEVGEGVFQNKRCSHVFKQANRFDGQAYDIEGRIFWEWYIDKETGKRHKSHFTNSESFVPITFPYTPSKEYVEKSHGN